MPRVYKRKNEPLDREKVQECLQYMRDHNTSLLAAANHFQLDESTVRYHRKRKLQGQTLAPIGRLPSIPEHLETELALVCRVSAEHGFGLQKVDVQQLIGEYIKENIQQNNEMGEYLRANCRFNEGVPSADWVTSFMKLHHLSLRKPSPLERVRKEAAADPFVVYEFYSLLEKEIESLHLQNSPQQIYNLDESAFFVDPRGGKVIAETGSKVQRVISTSGRNCFTAMACVNAVGTALPPLVIFDAKNLYSSWKGQRAIRGTMYACSGKFVSAFRVFTRHFLY
jgi:hypothetical protein